MVGQHPRVAFPMSHSLFEYEAHKPITGSESVRGVASFYILGLKKEGDIYEQITHSLEKANGGENLEWFLTSQNHYCLCAQQVKNVTSSTTFMKSSISILRYFDHIFFLCKLRINLHFQWFSFLSNCYQGFCSFF